MRPRWLLLAVSVICLLLVPATLSGQGIWGVCGTPEIDGVLSPDEWPVVIPGTDPGTAFPAAGYFTFMNDTDAAYFGAQVDVLGAPVLPPFATHPDYWRLNEFSVAFTDEADPLDDAFASTICPSDEGYYRVDAAQNGPFSFNISGNFNSGREVPGGGMWCPPIALGPGVDFAASPGDDVQAEMAVEFGTSFLDKVGPGDCVRAALYANVAASYPNPAPPPPILTYLTGMLGWPPGIGAPTGPPPWPIPDVFGVLCFDPCEPAEEFVPEPGTVMLLASGLMGMAGYAGLRLRKK